MLNIIELLRTHTERTDVNKTVKRSIDIPGHEERIVAHCARVQREYFDSGVFYKETHPTEIETKRCSYCALSEYLCRCDDDYYDFEDEDDDYWWDDDD